MSTFNEREYPAKRKPNYSLTELEYYLEVLTQNRKSAIGVKVKKELIVRKLFLLPKDYEQQHTVVIRRF